MGAPTGPGWLVSLSGVELVLLATQSENPTCTVGYWLVAPEPQQTQKFSFITTNARGVLIAL